MTSKKTIEKSKLIKLLSTFSALEWKRFGRFVQSPYHNSNQHLIHLYTLLKKAFPFTDLKTLEQERLHKKIYGREVFKLSKFQNLCSDLYELASDFIIEEHLNKEKRKKKKLLIDALSERNYELFKGASQQLIKEVETQEYFLDEVDFLLLYQLNDGLWNHLEKDKYNITQVELEKSWKNLNNFYEGISMQIQAEDKSTQNFLDQKNGLTQTDNSRLKNLFEDAKNLHQHKQPEQYFRLKDKVLNYWDKLKIKHKTNLLVHLLNFSFTNELIQKEFGHQEALDLYKIGVKYKLFIINGKMRDVEFINIGMIGFSLKEYDWTDKFIQNHIQYLLEESKPFLVSFIHAYKANYQKNYALVIELLSQLSPINQLRYLPKMKSLLIRAYFEGVVHGIEEYRSPLDYEIDSLKKMMIRNNKLANLKIKGYINFLNLTKKLLSLFLNKPYDSKKIHSFELLLTNTRPLILKSWLHQNLTKIKNISSF